jgi:multidrug efflux pump subunit AcrA (membrane-fusion protein)
MSEYRAVVAACIAALQTTQHAQQAVAARQGQFDRAVNALVAAAVQQSRNPSTTAPNSSSGTTSPVTGPSRGSTAPTTGNSTRPSTGLSARSTAGTGSPTTKPQTGSGSGRQSTLTVGAAEAAVTKAQLALDAAEAKRDAATMTAPIDGTVSAVPFAKGDTATTNDAVVIIGQGAVSVQMAVSEAAFSTLKVGQTAVVATPGGARTIGRVSARGLLPTESTSGSSATTFPVTVTATGQGAAALPAGATATVTVTLRSSPNAVIIPVSAVTRSGRTGVVRVLANGTVTTTTVQLGAIGTTTVEVTSGVTPGQTLVIADNTTALPTNSSNRGLRGGAPGGAPPGGVAGNGAPPGGR